MKKENSNKIKVKSVLAVYYKDEDYKTIERVVLKLIGKSMTESRFYLDSSKL